MGIGYGRILISPRVDVDSVSILSWANTSYESIRGTIRTAWTLTAISSKSIDYSPFQYNLEVTTPPNTYAIVSFPTRTIQWRYMEAIPQSSIWKRGLKNKQFEANG